jgi:hypothetical protein
MLCPARSRRNQPAWEAPGKVGDQRDVQRLLGAGLRPSTPAPAERRLMPLRRAAVHVGQAALLARSGLGQTRHMDSMHRNKPSKLAACPTASQVTYGESSPTGALPHVLSDGEGQPRWPENPRPSKEHRVDRTEDALAETAAIGSRPSRPCGVSFWRGNCASSGMSRPPSAGRPRPGTGAAATVEPPSRSDRNAHKTLHRPDPAPARRLLVLGGSLLPLSTLCSRGGRRLQWGQGMAGGVARDED